MNQSESKSDAMLLLDVPFEILRLTEDCTNRSGNSVGRPFLQLK
jgi:hypothetical protein